MQPRPFQRRDLDELKAKGYVALLNQQPGAGKGHPLDEPVLTPTGWKPVGQLTLGEEVVGSDGKGTKVTGIYDRGILPVYRVNFWDGSSVRVDGDHLWTVNHATGKGIRKWRTLSTNHLRRLVDIQTLSIPTVAVEHPEAELPIHPYALGALIADGSLAEKSSIQWTKNNKDTAKEMRRCVEMSGAKLTKRKKSEGFATRYGIVGLTIKLEDLGLRVKSKNKRVPAKYFISSLAQRVELVQGLFDGDGRVRKERGTASYSTVSEGLADDVQHLLWSIGVNSTKELKKHPRGNYWAVKVWGEFNPFKTHPDRGLVTGTRRPFRRSFKSIDLIGEEEVRCIRVEAEDHLYVTKDYIVTHNTVEGVFAAHESGAKQILIIAPLGTHESAWGRTVRAVTGQEVRPVGNTKKAEKEALTDLKLGYPGYYIITPQLFTRSDIDDWTPDMAIVDEVHMLGKAHKKGQEKLEQLGQQVPMKLALSGTPSRRAFERNWAIMRFLWPERNGRGEIAYINHYMWQKERMTSEIIYTNQRDQWGQPKKATKWLNEAEPGRLYSEAPCVLQHFRRERCCEFHPEGFLEFDEPNVIERTVELHPKQKKAIKEMETQYLAWLGDNPMIADLTLTQKQRIRQLCLGVPSITYERDEDGEEKAVVDFKTDCESPFADEVEKILGDLDENEPVVVYLESQKFARVLTERLNQNGWKAAEYSGKTTKNRDEYLNRFGRDIQVLVLVISAGGTGLDGLQEKSNTEIWVEHSVDDTNNEQAQARQDRLGAKKQVQRYIINDDMGYSEGQLSSQLTKRVAINKSNRKAA